MGLVSQTVATPEDAAAHFGAKLAFETDPADVMTDLRSGEKDFVLLDARAEAAFIAAHLPGAQHLPHAAIDEATAAHFLPDRDRLVVCYCWSASCNAADKAAAKLAALGYRVKIMIGGIHAWRKEGYMVEGARA
ncbi:MAG: rhodanese-like domain-containing protein [Thermoplasmatota archaeon]